MPEDSTPTGDGVASTPLTPSSTPSIPESAPAIEAGAAPELPAPELPTAPPLAPPSYPPYPYQGASSQPLPPGYVGPGSAPYGGAGLGQPALPTDPMLPGQPGGYPMQAPYAGPYAGPYTGPYAPPWASGAPVATMAPPRPRELPAWFRALARPLPLWARIAGGAGLALLLGLIFLAGDDWGNGVLLVGIGAGALALLVALGTGVRSLAGMASAANATRARQFVGAGVLALLLVATCGAGIVAASPLHRAQAADYEGRQQWQHALTEYGRSGEQGPAARDLARVYDEWGDQLRAAGQYAAAIEKYGVVIASYAGVPQSVALAQSGTVAAYLAWGKEAAQQSNYQAATQHLDTLLALAYCASDCQAQAVALDATAYFNLAEAKLAANDFKGAVDAFDYLVSRFAGAPEVTQAHGDAAKALLGLGQQQLAGGTCGAAIPTYQELARKYGDTPQGQQAGRDLARPQPVRGHFTASIPGGAFAVLTKGITQGMSDAAFFAAMDRGVRVSVSRGGAFAFPPVSQGAWDLAWGYPVSAGTQYMTYFKRSDGTAYFQAQVGPLCAVDMGDITETFISSQSTPPAPVGRGFAASWAHLPARGAPAERRMPAI